MSPKTRRALDLYVEVRQTVMMGFDMMATARELVWSGIGPEGSREDRRRLFYQRFYGLECPW